MSTEKLVKAPERRVRRSPVEGRNYLNVKGKDPNFVYRIVNITEDRVNDFLDRGWELDVDESVRVGDSRLDNSSKLGTVRQLSVGGGVKAVLMKIRKEWYDEDQEAKLEYSKKLEDAQRPNPNDGGYGKVDITRK